MPSPTPHVPRVSLGMPVYNAQRFLREVLDSILAQTFTDFELIISDNGSTDATESICREYAARDPRVLYYPNDRVNHGPAWNYNRTEALARGEYFKWAAADDLLAPTLLENASPPSTQIPALSCPGRSPGSSTKTASRSATIAICFPPIR